MHFKLFYQPFWSKIPVLTNNLFPQHLVPIIPVVARSDALTTHEKTEFQTRLNQEITANQLNLFNTSAFYTICSLDQKRDYQWGVSLVNNSTYSDLTKLRQFLQCVQKFWSDYLNLVIFRDFQNNIRPKNRNFQNFLAG